MKLTDFRKRLQSLTGDADSQRPFVCDGDPYTCTAFLVGFNPASTVPFWPFWNDTTGFDKEAWSASYLAHRKAQPLKEGRTRRQAVSATRQRIEWIVGAAQPVRILETNLYAQPTSQASDLAHADRTPDSFAFLVAEIAPRVLLLHGKEVGDAFEARYRCTLTDTYTSMIIEGHRMQVAGVRHLSRGVSQARAVELGQMIRLEVER